MLRLGNARALLVAALIAGAMGPAYPDDFGGVRILAYGNNTCGSFVKSDPQVKQMYLAWSSDLSPVQMSMQPVAIASWESTGTRIPLFCGWRTIAAKTLSRRSSQLPTTFVARLPSRKACSVRTRRDSQAGAVAPRRRAKPIARAFLRGSSPLAIDCATTPCLERRRHSPYSKTNSSPRTMRG